MIRPASRLNLQVYLNLHGKRLWRLLGALVILIASAVLAPRAVEGAIDSIVIVGVCLAVAATAVLVQWPGLGFPLIIFSSFLVPFGIGTGTLTSINSTLLLVGGLTALWVLDMLTRQKRIAFLNSRTVAPSLAFMVVALLSLGFGQFNWLPTTGASLNAQLGGLSIFLLSACAFLVTAHRATRLWHLQTMTWLLIILGAVYVAAVLLPVPGVARLAHRTFGRAVQDSLFWLWLVALTVSQAVVNRRLPMPIRLGLVVLALSTLYINLVIKQGWTSGWFPALAAAYVIVLLRYPRLGIVAGLVGAVGLLVSNIFLAGDNAYSMTTRLEAWRILFELIRHNPLLGLGPANYYFYTPFFEILGYYVRFNSHNNYIDIVAQIGFAGLACFLWLMAEIGRVGWRLRRWATPGFSEAYVYGAIGGLVGTLVAAMLGDWVLPFVYNIGLEGFRASVFSWLFLGGLVALEGILRTQAASVEAGGTEQALDRAQR